MNRDKEVFTGALALTGAERAAYLEQACAGDVALAERIDALLRAHALAQSFLTSPPTQQMAASPEEKPSDKIGRYKLLEKIGEGGCGVVWMAEQEEPVRRRVALKVIKLGMDTKSVVARFEAERQALALMDHPNIARVFDAGTTDLGRPFFVMELVRGVPITRYCDDASLSTEQRLELFISVCHAIQHAHQKGIIHRDIKPSNILVAQHDDIAVPKVIDFGIAKATQGRLTDATVFTAFEQFIGTPAYMSPEQAEFSGLDVDTRSDVYSLGVLLYELLTGKPPFDPKSLQQAGLDEVRRIIREVEPPRPSTRLSTLALSDRTVLAKLRGTLPAQLSTQISGDLDWIVMKSLEKNRTRRYESASAFALDVSRHLSNEAVVARPPSQAYLLEKLIRRHRFAFAAAAVVAVTLILGAVVSTWQAIRARRAEREAKHSQQIAAAAEQTARRGEQEQARLRGIETDLRQQAEAQALAIRRQSYAADMNLVQQTLASESIGRAKKLLDRQRPKPGEMDLRGWEWRYLWQFCQSEAAWSLEARDESRFALFSISHEGEWLTCIGSGLMWNLRSRQPVPIPMPEGQSVFSSTFARHAPWLAIQSYATRPDGLQNMADVRNLKGTRLIIWDYRERKVISEWSLDHLFAGAFQFSDEGRELLTAHQAEVVRWNPTTGDVLQRFSKTYTASGIALNGDFSVAALEWQDASVKVIETASGKERWLKRVAKEHLAAIRFSPDGKRLATAGHGVDTTVTIWDAATGAELGTLRGHRAPVQSIVFWPDGRTVATGSQDQTIRIWDLSTFALKRTLRGHHSPIMQRSLHLLPDSVTLASSGDGVVRFWDTNAPRAPGAYTSLEPQIAIWNFTGDGSVVAIERSGQVARWEGRKFDRRTPLLQLPDGAVRGEPLVARVFALPRDIPLLPVAMKGGHVQIWNWERGVLVADLATPAETAAPVAFLAQGARLLLDYADAKPGNRGLFEWDIAGAKVVRSWPRTALRGEYVVSPDERWCLVRPHENRTHFPLEPPQFNADRGSRSLIDLRSGTEQPLAPAVVAGEEVARFSNDGRLFAAPMISTTAVYSVPDFTRVATLGGTNSGMHGAAFVADGRRLVVGATGHEALRLWDTEGWHQVLTLEAPASMFHRVACSPDGNVIGALSYWNTLHLWRAPSWAEIAAAELLAAPKP